jgi:APA family basic amino acid/polyamine antiporter
MRVKNPSQARPFRTPWVPLIPILGILFNFALMYSLGWSNWVRLFVWLVIGQGIYFGYGRRHSRLREPAAGR